MSKNSKNVDGEIFDVEEIITELPITIYINFFGFKTCFPAY